ncbi:MULTISPECIES: rhodanese-like domain-containing protein [unclassified Halomonas]|jgi:rhodanese-related sulfurtransferase|uniref:Rhodanese-like domain-containing protein n=1 Tax=Halomonas sp. RT37 TaxID=2950872 RepID=A0AAU7KHT7_9GAMM|nr:MULTISPECIES: rhodanese-like domain-containing protein [unclassified Halomonas]MBR9773434.1 rhodanese-like domain-containing protein [Gammaproteobacteria bacterium]MBS8271261.1 rhodanese-like domain-containing protein [Halomonas litopenaei]MAR74672.1 rhodanese-like domain-containing protein [Halomonas sp.]MAY71290.1 rhodanese-like domain-containing protein [Halomonas sp.]MBR9879247.1 rhodanese-like domain-containing protein [Gammaproteobacteria bacterium]|tara:strand:- start:1305 stop:1517 length:213 start_codon:yes stop_codon:yes gene_type:complete
MPTIDTATLRDWQRRYRNVALVDTLPAAAFAKGHLPGAINIVSDDILDEAPRRLPDKQATIVVYCASEDC